MRAQTRFEETEHFASRLLEELAGPDDVHVGRLLLLRSVAVLNAWDDYERAARDAKRALPLVRKAGDPALELDALQLTAQIDSERGGVAPDAWVEIERLARNAGRWEAVANATRMQAWEHLDDEPGRALPLISAAAEVAAAHGLVEDSGWADYMLAEAHMCAGRWEESVEAGLRAIELGERSGYHRVVVRSWFVLLPIARAQGRRDLIEQAFPRFEQRARLKHEADSYYARIAATATHLHFAALGLEPGFVPDIAERLPCFDMDHGGPSWVAGLETVGDAWLRAGELEAVEEALARMRMSLSSGRAQSSHGPRKRSYGRGLRSPARMSERLSPLRRRQSRTLSVALRGGERRRFVCSSRPTGPIHSSPPRRRQSRAGSASQVERQCP